MDMLKHLTPRTTLSVLHPSIHPFDYDMKWIQISDHNYRLLTKVFLEAANVIYNYRGGYRKIMFLHQYTAVVGMKQDKSYVCGLMITYRQ